MQLQTVTIIGVGLIGGSIAFNLKKSKQVSCIIGVDPNLQNLVVATEKNIIDVELTEITQKSLQSNIVIIATPVAVVPCVLQSISQFKLLSDTVITDVSSTKREVLGDYQKYLPEFYAHCVAGHPIAGCEKSGADNMIPNLFREQKVILCPHAEQDESSLAKVKQLWEILGADVYLMDVSLHDQIFAMTSHFPHILAYAFMNQLEKDSLKTEYLTFAGSGFRDFTRIAASDPEMWSGICVENQDVLLTLLAHYQQELEYMRVLLESKNKEKIKTYFSSSQKLRRAWGKE